MYICICTSIRVRGESPECWARLEAQKQSHKGRHMIAPFAHSNSGQTRASFAGPGNYELKRYGDDLGQEKTRIIAARLTDPVAQNSRMFYHYHYYHYCYHQCFIANIIIVIYRTWVGFFEVTMYWGLDMWFGGWRFGSCRG